MSFTKEEQEVVRVIKLFSGEEIICTATYEDKGIAIKDCILVIPQQGPADPQTGKTQIVFAFIPWGTLVKDSIFLDYSKIIYNEEPEDQLLAHYSKMTGRAQIQVPSKNLVIAR